VQPEGGFHACEGGFRQRGHGDTGAGGLCVCVWPPVKDELLLSMRFQSLVLTSMKSSTPPPDPPWGLARGVSNEAELSWM